MFVAYDVSIELIRQLRAVMPAVRRADKNLADQLGRAATSVALNLAEGRRRRGGDQRRFYEFAHGSAGEVRAALEVGAAWGWLDDEPRVLVTLDRLIGLLWGLARAGASLPTQ